MADLRIERVVVTGGRGFTDGARIQADLRALLPFGLQRMAHGAARGADGLADAAWIRMRREVNGGDGFWSCEGYPARWGVHGNKAGPLRNVEMLERERPGLVLAYPDPSSRGTWHCIEQAIARGIPVAVWSPGIGTLRLTGAETFDDEPRFILRPHASLIDSQHLAEALRG